HIFSRLSTSASAESVAKDVNDESTAAANGGLIYKGRITAMVTGAKYISLTSSLAALAMQPTLWSAANALPVVVQTILGFGTGFFIFTPIVLQAIVRKYVVEMAYDRTNDEYTVSTFTFFQKLDRNTFKRDEVDLPDTPKMFTTFNANGRGFMVD